MYVIKFPLKVVRYNAGRHDGFRPVDIVDATNERIVRVSESGETELAYAFAAAPELLSALAALVALYDSDEGCKTLPEYIAAQSAISKAKGV